MSSRNRYLSAEERRQALTLSRALHAAEAHVRGESPWRPPPHCCKPCARALEEEPAIRVDYVAIVDPDTLLPIENLGAGGLLAIAAYVGKHTAHR